MSQLINHQSVGDGWSWLALVVSPALPALPSLFKAKAYQKTYSGLHIYMGDLSLDLPRSPLSGLLPLFFSLINSINPISTYMHLAAAAVLILVFIF